MIRVALFCVLLTGCTSAPRAYVFGGLGYSVHSGDYVLQRVRIDDTGAVGVYGVGLKFNERFDCRYHHRSMVTQQPEFVANDIYCETKVFFGGEKK